MDEAVIPNTSPAQWPGKLHFLVSISINIVVVSSSSIAAAAVLLCFLFFFVVQVLVL